jgi:hypothetical protein
MPQFARACALWGGYSTPTHRTMYHWKCTLAAVALVSGSSIHAQDSGFGLGFILGEPTGVSFKSWLSSERAIDGAVAWSLGHGTAFRVHADYLFHSYDAITVSKGKLPLYYGPGVRLRIWDSNRYWRGGEWHDADGRADIAVRFPVGISYQFDGAPLDVFLEVAPALGLLPSTYFDVDGGLGLRYWF